MTKFDLNKFSRFNRENTSTRLYIDNDGVVADYDAHFPALFGYDHKTVSSDQMWTEIEKHQGFFRSMPVTDGAVDFFKAIEHLEPFMLTACPKRFYAVSARDKRAWVREHLSKDVYVLPVLGGRNKALFMHAPGDILIDDWEDNIEAWNEEGGIGILHTDFNTTAEKLYELLSKDAFR